MKLFCFIYLLLFYVDSFDSLSSPFLSFPVSCHHALSIPLPLLLPLVLARGAFGATIGEGGQLPCWGPYCQVSVIEGEELALDAPPASESQLHEVKVTCRSDGVRIKRLQDLCIHQLPSYTRILEIFNTSITRIESSAFINLNHLRKIDLRNNKVKQIDPSAFRGLSFLKRLDLSYNNISSLNGSQLEGLEELVRLKVGHNPLKELRDDLQDALPSLRAIELADTFLRCDCHLSWLLKTSENDGSSRERFDGKDERSEVSKKKRRPLRILGAIACQSPKVFRGMKLRKLNPNQMICEKSKPSSVTILEMDPGIDQVVFAGDSLKLMCRVTGFDSPPDRVWWRLGQEGNRVKEVIPKGEKEHYDDVTVTTSSLKGTTESFIHIPELNWDHSGEWSCVVEGNGQNSSRSLSVYVIHHNTKYCPVNVTYNNKGTYSWPRTVASVRVELPCQGIFPLHPSASSSWPSLSISAKYGTRHARHLCDDNGIWHSLDTEQCPYVSEITRILEHFANTNLTLTGSSLSDSARTLRNFTANNKAMSDPIDIFFLSKTVQQYVHMLSKVVHAHPIAEVLIDVIGSVMSSTRELLESTEYLYGSCSSLLSSLWQLTDYVPTLVRAATPYLHLYQVGVRPQSFNGVSCVWFRKTRHSTDRHFRCNTNNYSLLYAIEEELTDARIRIPPELFSSFIIPLNASSEDKNKTEIDNLLRLQFFVYESAKFFPSERADAWQITSPVIGVRLNNGTDMVGDGIYVTLRSAIYSHNIAPAVWDYRTSSIDGGRFWRKGECNIVRVHNSLVVFKCKKLAHFGLLQDMAALRGSKGRKGNKFKLSPPGVYVGSTICCFFLMASIATWAIHHERIGTMSKNKHSFLNTWIALLFLIALFTVGIYQTETPVMCQTIGVLLHYLTTCVLLWIIVSVTNLYKKVTKVLRPSIPSDEPPSETPLPPKPMLRFYLVGWGIALIVCGISAAVNLRHYGTFSYCFLAWHPSMAAFYAPCAVLVSLLTSVFLLTQCVLNAGRTGYSEATANTETTELELLDATSPASENPPSGRADDELSIASQTSSLSLADAQHSPTTQLRAHAVTLILFLLTWASAAITAATPFASVIPFHTVIFSVMYAVCSSSLGIFIFVFFCVSRSDVMEAWKEFSLICLPQAKEDEAQLTVANNVVSNRAMGLASHSAPANNQLVIPTSTSPCVAPSVRSLESSHTHHTNKSSSLSHSFQASNKAESLSKTSNALHTLNLSALTETTSFVPEMFYNPKQAGVAKRFFQKQRLKQMMKQNNLEMNRTDSDCNSSTVYKPRKSSHLYNESDVSGFDASYLVLSNKINNTNIHVDSMYMGSKHTAKALTPELLCVLGPPKDTCSIVSSVENDQHQWPINIKHQCIQNPVFYHPKHLNVPLPQGELGQRVSPVLFQEMLAPTVNIEQKSPDARARKSVNRYQRGQRPFRTRRKRSRSRGSGREDLEWSEEEVVVNTTPLKGTDTTSSGVVNSSPLQEEGHRTHLNTRSITPTSFSPLSHTPSPLPPTLPSAAFSSPTSLSPTPPHLLRGFPTPSCGELEWMHLLNKRRHCDEDVTIDPPPRNPFYVSCSEGESTEGGVERESWESELEGRVFKKNSADAVGDDSFDGESIGGCSSVATSMAPGADPSPPPSLPVSDSPFDSPLHKFHQNTPDSLSLDSGSLFSPLRSQFPSMDNPSLHNIASPTSDLLESPLTPTLTPTTSTPVNPPASPVTPTGDSQENDVDFLGSSSDITRKTRSSSHDGIFNSSLDTVCPRRDSSSLSSEAISPFSSLPRDVPTHTNLAIAEGYKTQPYRKKVSRHNCSARSSHVHAAFESNIIPIDSYSLDNKDEQIQNAFKANESNELEVTGLNLRIEHDNRCDYLIELHREGSPNSVEESNPCIIPFIGSGVVEMAENADRSSEIREINDKISNHQNESNKYEDRFGESNQYKDLSNESNEYEDRFGESNQYKDLSNESNKYEDRFDESNQYKDLSNESNKNEDRFGESNQYKDLSNESNLFSKHCSGSGTIGVGENKDGSSSGRESTSSRETDV